MDISPTLLELQPGASAQLQVSVTNFSQIVDEFEIGLVSTAPGISAVPQRLPLLDDGRSGSATLVVAVTAGHGAPPAGQTVIGVRVHSLSDPSVSQVEEVRLTVGSAGTSQLSVEPKVVRGGGSARLQLIVTNNRNSAHPVGFSGEDTERLVRFSFEPQVVTVPPWSQQATTVTVRARRPLTGADVGRQLTFRAEGGPEPLTDSASFIQSARVHPTVPRVIGAVIALAVIAGSVLLAAFLTRDDDDNTTVAGGQTTPPVTESVPEVAVETVSVPPVAGLSEVDAASALTAVGLSSGSVIQTNHESVPNGVVIDAVPPPGTVLDPGTEVALLVSTGPQPPPTVPVPDLAELDEDAAVDALGSACDPEPCFAASVARDFSDDVVDGVVLRQEPSAGAAAEIGSQVTVIISLGPEETEPEGTAATPFVGMWTNEDLNTGGNTRFEIGEVDGMVAVHAFGKCHPTDCDWETELGTVSGSTASLVWDQGFVVRQMEMELLDETRMKVTTSHQYTDSRPDRFDEAFFLRTG